MQNLIDNALKFTPASGRIIIQTNKAERGIKVSVSHLGIGIPERKRAPIWKVF